MRRIITDDDASTHSYNKIRGWKVFTPAGIIFCATAKEAHDYKKTYGYPIKQTT